MLFLSSQIQQDHVPVNRNAIVSMVISDRFVSMWVELCQDGWINYALRHGFDIIMVNVPLDSSSMANARSPAWQKLLILEQPWAQKYERVVWLDSDILIHPAAPNILDCVLDHSHIGVASIDGELETGRMHVLNERLRNLTIPPIHWPRLQRVGNRNLFRESASLDIDDTIKMYCTGVLVVSPEYHRDLFRRSYYNYNIESRLYEQPGLSLEICRSGKVTEFTPRFNWMVMIMVIMYYPEVWCTEISDEKYLEILPILRKEFDLSYFLHFAGCSGLMQKIRKGDMDLASGSR